MGSSFLFAMPSAFAGIGRTLDIGGTFDGYSISRTPEEADALAMFLDWRAVGRDLSQAMDQIGREQQHADTRQPAQLALGLGEK